MCFNPVKTLKRRYESAVFLKNKVITSDLWEHVLYNPNKYAYYPCGKCYECQESKIEAWQIRWKEHLNDSINDSNYLLTLTYKDADLPHLDGQSSLWYPDIQKFFKRLRKAQNKYTKENNLPDTKITYHGCGEYGTKFTKRPHYHILISNLLIVDQVEKIWSHGKIHIGDNVTPQTIKYVLKYTLKNSVSYQKKDKITDKNGKYLYHKIAPNQKNAGRISEKTFCSKSIGKNFITPQKIKHYHKNPSHNYLWDNYTKDGKAKLKPLPRYYKELIFNPPKLKPCGKILRDDHNRPVRLWSPLDENFENTPRFRKMLAGYEKEKQQMRKHQDHIKNLGYDQYLENQRINKHNKYAEYKRHLAIRETLQQDKNAKFGALLI